MTRRTPIFSDGAVANLVGIGAAIGFGVMALYGAKLLHDFIAALRVRLP